jgi:hypothetical protein
VVGQIAGSNSSKTVVLVATVNYKLAVGFFDCRSITDQHYEQPATSIDVNAASRQSSTQNARDPRAVTETLTLPD